MGAWIEIYDSTGAELENLSLPAWERGLKSVVLHVKFAATLVAPRVGAWIEIAPASATPFNPVSLPAWERGLK